MATLRSLLPLEPPELAGVAAAVAALLAELHARGDAHGAVSADTVLVVEGRVVLADAPPVSDPAPADDVAALGRVVSAALVGSPDAPTLAAVAASARRAALGDGPAAADLAREFATAVPAPRLPGPKPRTTQRAPAEAAESASRRAAALRLVLWLGLLGTTVVVVPMVATDLTPPPLLEGVDAIRAWADGRDAADLVVSMLRIVVLGLAWYLLGTTALGVALRAVAGAGPAGARIADALLVPQVRRLVHVAFGATLSAGALAATAGASAGSSPPVMRQLVAPGGAVMQQVEPGGEPVATMLRLDPEATSAPAPAEPGPQATTWTVRAGDHLWGIAEAVLADAWATTPTDADVDPYWRTVVDVNRDLLADRDNPDLLFPGQQLRVPPPPPPSL